MRFESIGHNFCHDSNFRIVRPCGLDWYLLLIIRSKAYYERKGERVSLNPGSLVVFAPNTPQIFGADGEAYVNDWVAFTPNEREKHLLSGIPLDCFADGDGVKMCSELIHIMQTESRTGDEDMLCGLFRLVLKKLAVVFGAEKADKPYFGELKSVRERIYENPSERFSVQSLADELHLSKSYFQHIYKECFGVPPTADIIHNRTEYAKRLLDSTAFSVSRISEKLGYGSDVDFIKQFRKQTGMTPLEYRKR